MESREPGAAGPHAAREEGERGYDAEYRQWRQEQARSMDRDCHSWRRERCSSDFAQWRAIGAAQAGLRTGSGPPAGPWPYLADEAALAGAMADLAGLCERLCERLWLLALWCLDMAGLAAVSAGALAEAAGAVAAADDEDVCANETAATPEIRVARRTLLSLDME